jgi:hypothetical protein
MRKVQSVVSQLDQVISAVEHLILTASDEEVLAEHASDAKNVKVIVSAGIASGASRLQIGTLEQQTPKKSKKRNSQSLSDWQIKIAFFRKLMTARPDLSPHLGAVFGTGRTPTSAELDELTNELVRLGLISDIGANKKK